MKIFLVFFFSLFALTAFSQEVSTGNNPAFFFDSVQVNSPGIFDQNKIEDIYIVKRDSIFPNGRIYIKSKDPKDFKFLSAKNISDLYNIPIGTNPVFLLDNEIINDTAQFKIDSSYVLNVEIIKASEIDYLPNNIPSLAILKILTASEENKDKQKVIRIRGKGPTLFYNAQHKHYIYPISNGEN